MKALGIAVLVIGITTTAQAQSIGALARAERKRQQEVAATKIVVKEIPAPVEKAAPPAVDTQSIVAAHAAERAELDHEKAILLNKLSDVIHDRKAVQDIEQRLTEIQKRSDELKQEIAAGSKELASKTETKTDTPQK